MAAGTEAAAEGHNAGAAVTRLHFGEDRVFGCEGMLWRWQHIPKTGEIIPSGGSNDTAGARAVSKYKEPVPAIDDDCPALAQPRHTHGTTHLGDPLASRSAFSLPRAQSAPSLTVLSRHAPVQ